MHRVRPFVRLARRAHRGRARPRALPRRAWRPGSPARRRQGLQVPGDRPDAPERPLRRLRGAGPRAAHDLRGDRLRRPLEVGQQRHHAGNPSSTTSRSFRSATSRSPTPIRTSSGSAPASTHPRAARTGATASTSRSTRARRGRTWGSRTATTSAASSSTRPTPNIVYVAALGHLYSAERRARRLQDHRRRQDLDEVARGEGRRPDGRRLGPRDGSEEPEDPLCRRLRQGAAALDVQPRRPGQRHLQDDRRRQDLDEARRRPAGRHARPNRRRRLREEPA